ncbi:MAG: hypothetical protein ACI9FU_001563 [Granulosicoccus sp.]|jgi:hypothetical protein
MLLLKILRTYLNIKMLVLIAAFCLPSASVYAQFYNGSQMEFGKNRVQFNKFEWSFFRFDKFDVYFYVGGQEQAIYAMRSSDRMLQDLEKKLDYTMNNRFQIVIYNRLSDLRQSNIGAVTDEDHNTGGAMHIVGKKLILYFNGDYVDFEKQLKSGLTQVMINNMMFGGKLKDVIRNSTLLNIPPWFTGGLIQHLGRGWDAEINNTVRDGITSGRWEKFNRLEGQEAIDAGQSLWQYISDTYGESTVSNILYMTRISRSVDSGLMFVLGVSLKNIIAEWLNYYDKKYYKQEQKLKLPEEKPLNRITKKPHPECVFGAPSFSANSKYLAYKKNDQGRIKVYLKDLQTGKKKVVFRQGYRSHRVMDPSYPIMAWHPSSELLTIVTEHKGKIKLLFYNLKTKKTDEKEIFYFQKVTSAHYSSDGKSLAMTAVLEGRSDLFVYNIISNTYNRITNDNYTDQDARYLDGSHIIFSSNRANDTIRDVETDLLEPGLSQDLFIYDLNGKDKVLRRVTSTADANETNPELYANSEFSYLSDAKGTINRHLGRLDSNIAFIDTITHYNYFTHTRPITNFPRNISSYAVDTTAGTIADVILANGNYRLTLHPREKEKNVVTSGVKQQSTFLDDNEKSNEGNSNVEPLNPTVSPVNEEPEKPFDPDNIDIFNFQFESELNNEENKTEQASDENEEVDSGTQPRNPNMPDRLSRKLERNKARSRAKHRIDSLNAALNGAQQPDNEWELPQQRYYHTHFFVDQVITQLDNNFINTTYQRYTGGGGFVNPGLNFFSKLGASDLFEDYKIVGGFRIVGNLNNSEYFLTAQNFKKRLDQQLTFHRQAVQSQPDFTKITKVQTHSLIYKMTWPFAEFVAVTGTVTGRSDRTVVLSDTDRNLRAPDQYKWLGGLKGEFIFDNTISNGINLYRGTRMKVFGEYYQNIDSDAGNLAVVGVDIRNYQKVHREIIWANRFAASTNFGTDKLVYYLGGVDDWIAADFDNTMQVDPTKNYQYQSLATNMRGFSQNIRNGTSFALINSELRIPLFRYLFNRPLRSDFLHNFQVVGFGDIGTAWTGLSPFSEDNNLNREVIDLGSTVVTLRNRREPIVGGFGVGIRARILGYFIRVDRAWGVENFKVNDGIWYISLSVDF